MIHEVVQYAGCLTTYDNSPWLRRCWYIVFARFIICVHSQQTTVQELISSQQYNPNLPAPNQNFLIVNGNLRSGCSLWGKLFKVTANVMDAYYRRNKDFDDVQDNPRAIVQNIEVTLLREKADALIVFERINWFNFTDFNRPQPTWLNTVRHPIDSFASQWYRMLKSEWLDTKF